MFLLEITVEPYICIHGQKVDGIDIPAGLQEYKDRIERDKKFATDKIEVFKKFVDTKKIIDEKKANNQPLTPEEQEIDQIDSTTKLYDWQAKEMEKKGYKVATAGTTDQFGNVERKTPAPKTPYENFEDDLTMKVHEPSHVEGAKKIAQEVGLDWDKWQEYGKLLKKIIEERNRGKTIEEIYDGLSDREKEIIRWKRENQEKIEEYLRKRNDPVNVAKEDIGEYEAENKIREKTLELFKPKPTDDNGKEGTYFPKYLPIYTCAIGFDVLTTYPIYVVKDTHWIDNMSIPARVPETAITVTTDSNGTIAYSNLEPLGFSPALIWPFPLPGRYDIIIDVNNDGIYNSTVDALDDNYVDGAGFIVISLPYVGGESTPINKIKLPLWITPVPALAAIIVTAAIATLYKRKNNLRKIHKQALRK